MTLAIFTAGDVLAAALAVPGLPAAIRDDATLTGFLPTSEAGIGSKLAVNTNGADTLETMMGEPQSHELGAGYTIIFAVEGEPGLPRDNVFRAGCEAIAGVLFPGGVPLSVAGVFDDLNLGGGVEVSNIAPGEQGNSPMIVLDVRVSLTLTAPTQLG